MQEARDRLGTETLLGLLQEARDNRVIAGGQRQTGLNAGEQRQTGFAGGQRQGFKPEIIGQEDRLG